MENNLNAAAITRNLGTRFIGKQVLHYHSLPSTMDDARQGARAGAPAGTVIIADRQTAGRGRLRRQWLSPEGSIALSIILRPEISYLPLLIMMAALAVVHSIEKVAGLTPRIKWPNDILINNKKVCGILIETAVRQNTVQYAIVGIGINVNVRLAELSEIKDIATSLSIETGHEVSRLEMVRQLLLAMENQYMTLPQTDSIYREWQSRLLTLGKKVSVVSGDSTIEGIAESVNKQGRLLLRLADGNQTEIIAGDVTLREVS